MEVWIGKIDKKYAQNNYNALAVELNYDLVYVFTRDMQEKR